MKKQNVFLIMTLSIIVVFSTMEASAIPYAYKIHRGVPDCNDNLSYEINDTANFSLINNGTLINLARQYQVKIWEWESGSQLYDGATNTFTGSGLLDLKASGPLYTPPMGAPYAQTCPTGTPTNSTSNSTTTQKSPVQIMGKYTVLKASLDSLGDVKYGINNDNITTFTTISGKTLINMAISNSYAIYEDPASVKIFDPNTGLTSDGVDDLILPPTGPIKQSIITNVTSTFQQKTYTVAPFVVDVMPDKTGNNIISSNYGNSSISFLNTNGLINTCHDIGGSPDYKTIDSQGNIWIAVAGGISKISPTCQVHKYTLGWIPFGMYADQSDKIWITDFENNTLTKLDPTTNATTVTHLNVYGLTQIEPDKLGNFWFASFGNDTLERYSLVNNTIKTFCCTGFRPADLGLDIYGNIWTVEEGNSKILSSVTEFYPNNSTFKVYNGIGPIGEEIKADRYGDMWVGYDSTYSAISEIKQNGEITNYEGIGNYPNSVDFDRYNNLYVGNWGSGTVIVITNTTLPFNATSSPPANTISSVNSTLSNGTIAYWQNQTSYWQSQSNSWENKYYSLVNQIKSLIGIS